MRRFLLLGFGLALLPAAAQARNCSEVLTIGIPYQVPYEVGPQSPPTFTWRVSAQNNTPTRQTMQIWLVGINNVQNPVNPATRRPVAPHGAITWTLGRIAGPQPTAAQMQAAIRTTCEG